MKFIPNGPDIPEDLLQAHEDGKVVFFCGAGISYKVGLGNFKWLVEQIYRECNTVREPAEEAACNKDLYDTALNFLENRLPGGRQRMRNTLVQILQPNFDSANAKNTHLALLRLARNRDGDLRLVTTNFDRAFEEVAKVENLEHRANSAPMLPIPKVSQWNALVYLHGLLPEIDSDKNALDRLVLTSGDFGLAYLTERWAARFVSELFQNFIVCFVGYSINDPVIRYMTDAIAADRLRGESTNEFYALVSQSNQVEKSDDWESRDIIPILYDSVNNHELLHETIKIWSEDYRDGIRGKERVVADYALTDPAASTNQEDFIGRMLWAISDKSGLPAAKFANFDPTPPLAWLNVFSKENFKFGDLNRFGVQPLSDTDDIIPFSLIRRPAPYELSPSMELVSDLNISCKLDVVMQYLGQWLVRHLNDPDLLLWVVRNGGQLHENLADLIEQNLEEFEGLEREDETDVLDQIRVNSPNAIPNRFMKKLWYLLLNGQILTDCPFSLDIYIWKSRIRRHGLTTPLRLELRRLLAPKIKLSSAILRSNDGNRLQEPECMKDVVHYELEIFTDHARLTMTEDDRDFIRDDPLRLLDDFQKLLLDALDLLQELEVVDNDSDLSYMHLPSISWHPQNDKYSKNWVVLIELLRDAWLETRRVDPDRASRIAQSWFDLPYATFKRLALFAACQDGCIAPRIWINWLINNDSWWLWSVCTHRESMRLLVTQAKNLSEKHIRKLEKVILKGPPLEMNRAGVDSEKWERYVKFSIRLTLCKLAYDEKVLSPDSLSIVQSRSSSEASWEELRDNERNEFGFWQSGTGDTDFEDIRILDYAPPDKNELVEWLKRKPSQRSLFHEDDWQEICRTRFEDSIFALSKLSSEGRWPTEHWSDALRAWSKANSNDHSWEDVKQLLLRMPNDTFEEIAHAIARWLEGVSKTICVYDEEFIDICDRILGVTHKKSDIGSGFGPFATAINHPVGLTTNALLNIWYNQNPKDNKSIPSEIAVIFTRLCDTNTPCFRFGRVVLASRFITLYRADQVWAKENIFPLLDWTYNQKAALEFWAGFLWSLHFYPPLLIEIKQHFLTTAKYYSYFEEWRRPRYAEVLTHVGLGRVAEYSKQDIQAALRVLPEDGLQVVARTLYQTLGGSRSLRKEYWRNRTKPFLQHYWPQSKHLASEKIAEEFATIAIAAGSEFVEALGVISDWLQPLDSPERAIRVLYKSDIHKQFPNESLRLLNAIISEQSQDYYGLREVLDEIVEASSSMSEEPEYVRLEQICRRQGY